MEALWISNSDEYRGRRRGGIWIQGEGFGRETHAQSHLRKHKKLLSFKHYCVRLVLASRNTKCRANVKGTYSGENN